MPGDPKLYVLEGKKSAYMFCSLYCAFLFVGDNIAAGCVKDKIIPFLKSKGRLKFDQNVVVNHLIEKGKPQFKLSYNRF